MGNKGILLLLLFVFAFTSVANAASYNLSCITSNDTTGSACVTAETQMSVDVNNAGNNQIQFVFNNSGSDLSAFIADIYFYDGPLFGNFSMSSSGGVSFSQGAKPAKLPAYNKNGRVSFSADSDAPVAGNGIQSGEWLSVIFDLKSGYAYADIISLMNIGGPGGLVVGIHAQGLGANDYSESLITYVPSPAALILFGSGLLGLFGFAQRRKS